MDDLETQRKARLSSKKKSRPRRLSETYRLRHRTDSVDSDDLNTSLDPEPLDWSDLVEKEQSDFNESSEKVSQMDADKVKEKVEKNNQWIKVMNSSKVHKTVQARLKVMQSNPLHPLIRCSTVHIFLLQLLFSSEGFCNSSRRGTAAIVTTKARHAHDHVTPASLPSFPTKSSSVRPTRGSI